jgi:hypothetical protein
MGFESSTSITEFNPDFKKSGCAWGATFNYQVHIPNSLSISVPIRKEKNVKKNHYTKMTK